MTKECEKFHYVSVPNNADLVDYFFLYYEMINNDVANSIVLHVLNWY